MFRPGSVLPVKGDVMTTSILVTGGTGYARAARGAAAARGGCQRHGPQPPPPDTADGIGYIAGDLSTGAGIEAAVRGAEVIVHCAGSSKGDEQKTRTLVSAAKDPGCCGCGTVCPSDLTGCRRGWRMESWTFWPGCGSGGRSNAA